MKSNIVKCVDCGQEFEYQGYKKKERCQDCAWKRVEAVASQLHSKSGPEYEKWRKRMVEVGIPRQIAALEDLRANLARSESQF